jgi:hypothetical protein
LVAHFDETRPAAPTDRRVVIYNAGLRIVVADLTLARQNAEKLVEELGGYVQKIDGDNLTLRVPVANYQDAVSRLERFGQVSHRELEALDVTEEFVDLEARLRNAQAVRARLEALLAKAEDVKAALEVEKELTRITEEIERLEAKLELIRNRVAFSTITVWLERVARTSVTPRRATLPFTWLRDLDPGRLLN